ncbi:MAG: fasciclin domain-containing protein [Synechococcales cyanobacterium RM1_1_8]|nr:fasciclin domain-containing protein [Synechococcales cyanobacterium RM1_1_8]
MKRFSSLKFGKFAGIAAGLFVLPVAVACGSPTATTPDPAAETEPSTTEGTAPSETMPSETTAPPEAAASQTIVETAIANGSFNTLVAAVQAADLVDTLNGPGPFTVFAPTDEAFAALPAGVLDKLLLPENQAVLAQILTYHVVAGNVPASAVTTGPVPSVEGKDLDLVADAGAVSVNGANVVQADVAASNGVIHVIDAVLLPPGLDPSAL